MKSKKVIVMFGIVFLSCIMILSPALAWDNGDGTRTVKGLVWLKNPAEISVRNWYDAVSFVASLSSGQCGLTDNSTAGKWRLPTLQELKSVYPEKNYCRIPDHTGYYWTSDPDPNYPSSRKVAMSMYNQSGYSQSAQFDRCWVWPVRQ